MTLKELLNMNDEINTILDYKEVDKKTKQILKSKNGETKEEKLKRLQQMVAIFLNEFDTMSYDANIKGTIVVKYVKCGKKNCVCQKTDFRHGPYYYVSIRNGKDLEQIYIRKKDRKQMIEKYESNRRYLKAKSIINKVKREIGKTKRLIREEEKDG